MVDYAAISATATSLLQKFGRPVTLIKLSEEAADPDKPWNGPESTGEETLDLYGVTVDPLAQRQLGISVKFQELVVSSDKFMLVNPGSADISEYSQILDESVRYGITGIELLKPGDTNILAFIGMKR